MQDIFSLSYLKTNKVCNLIVDKNSSPWAPILVLCNFIWWVRCLTIRSLHLKIFLQLLHCVLSLSSLDVSYLRHIFYFSTCRHFYTMLRWRLGLDLIMLVLSVIVDFESYSYANLTNNFRRKGTLTWPSVGLLYFLKAQIWNKLRSILIDSWGSNIFNPKAEESKILTLGIE